MKADRWFVVIDKLAKDTGLDKTFLKDFIIYYWKNLKLTLKDIPSYRIEIYGLGYFQLSIDKSYALKKKLKGVINAKAIDTVKLYKQKIRIEKELLNIEKGLLSYEKDQKRYHELIIKRYGTYTPNMEKTKKYFDSDKE